MKEKVRWDPIEKFDKNIINTNNDEKTKAHGYK